MARRAKKLSKPVACFECGTKNDPGSSFCAVCGLQIEGRQTASLVGHKVGDWDVVRTLVSGGLGELYLAEKEGALGKVESVLKIPRVKQLKAGRREQVINALIVEAETLRNLAHENIVPFQDIVEYMGGIVLSMKYIHGEDLATLIARTYDIEHGKVLWEEAQGYIWGVLDALHFSHSHPLRPIVHGDVKPTNIRIERETRKPWLLDFGLAWKFHDEDARVPLGTLAYSAPEVLAREEAGPRSDMYSLAVTIYELLTGKQPYPLNGRRTAAEQLAFVVKHRPEPLSVIRNDIPVEVAQAVHKALSLDPEERFPDCVEFGNALFSAFSGSAPAVPYLSERKPGSQFGAYLLERKASTNPLWETWFASSGNGGGQVWLTIFHDRRCWPILGNLQELKRKGNDPHLRTVRAMDPYWRPPYVAWRADLDEKLLVEVLGRRELSAEESYACILQVLRGLNGLHRERTLHGLVSPETISVRPAAGHVRLFFGGLWSLLEQTLRQEETGERQRIIDGFPYLAPEQEDGGETARSCDAYAMGKLLVRLLGRKKAVHDTSDLLAGEGVTTDVLKVVAACLSPEPGDRPQEADGLLSGLTEATGRQDFSPGEQEFMDGVAREITAPHSVAFFRALEHFESDFELSAHRAFELVEALAVEVGADRWERFIAPYRDLFITAVERLRKGGFLDVEARLELEGIRLRRKIPRLVARYLETCPNPNERDIGGILYVKIPRSTFLMGSWEGEADEQPRRQVALDRFYISKFPITVEQYRVFRRETGHPEPAFPELTEGLSPSHPVCGVSHADALEFCLWMSERTGHKVDLPSEAQWEMAAAGREGLDYPWGPEPPDAQRSVFGEAGGGPMPVGDRPGGSSPYGVHDMSGNVWEWCRDWYDEFGYWKDAGSNPAGPDTGRRRVLRGGSFMSLPERLRCAARDAEFPDVPLPCYGFRVVLDMS